jgi:prepilin-type N-terminal cleavage/methylation domain-containing protein
MKKAAGFSLIELLVVIAIVALLAAIAVPSYKSYSAKAKASNAIDVMGNVITRSMMFADTKGRFAYPADLGTSGYYSGGCSGCVSPAFIGSPAGVDSLYIHEWTQNSCGGSAQGKVGIITVYFNSSLTGTAFNYTWWLTRANGVVQATCISSESSMNIGKCLSTNSASALVSAACASAS